MSSLFTTHPDATIKHALGRKENVPFYLQFVPGNVVDIVTSDKSLYYRGNNTINSIMALPHITNEPINPNINRKNLSDKYRYYPLFRGMVDVPVKGDPVLLCRIGNTNYYLGPLNTETNVPTFADDPNKVGFILPLDNQNISEYDKEVQESVLKGENPNFMNDKTNHKRLFKIYNDNLDHPWNTNTNLPDLDEDGSVKDRFVRDIHGDMLFEGRHGNSIRIGSRHKNPYIVISNGREENNSIESLGDGSLITITERGSLAQHFGGYRINNSTHPNAINGTLTIPEFNLASDSVYNFRSSMGELVKISNGGEIPSSDIIYGYTDNQILFNSDRITINTKKDDLFLSSYKDIHIGTGRNLTISTNEDLIIESRNIYLGKTVNYNDEGQGESRVMEPLVLGQKLVDILTDIVDCLSKAHIFTPSGATVPIIDFEKKSLAEVDGKGRKGLENIRDEIQSILSEYHYIEPNDYGNTKTRQ